jgi:hypothetical protein
VIDGAGPGYDSLRVQIGIYSDAQRNCSWRGQLRDHLDKRIEHASSGGPVSEGDSVVVLDFRGFLIRNSAGGPFTVGDVELECDGSVIRAPEPLLTINNFTAAEFRSVPPDITLSWSGIVPIANPGQEIRIPVRVNRVGPFAERVSMSVSGVPAGVTATFTPLTPNGSGTTVLKLAVPQSFAVGAYPISVSAHSATVTKTLEASFEVSESADVTPPSITPPSGSTPITITMTTRTAGASIRYTTDGSMPGPNAGTLVLGPVRIQRPSIVKAVAFVPGKPVSAVTVAAYAAP